MYYILLFLNQLQVCDLYDLFPWVRCSIESKFLLGRFFSSSENCFSIHIHNMIVKLRTRWLKRTRIKMRTNWLSPPPPPPPPIWITEFFLVHRSNVLSYFVIILCCYCFSVVIVVVFILCFCFVPITYMYRCSL